MAQDFCSYSRRDDWSIVGLCVSHHNVENGQKNKQDAWIIFWKFPYIGQLMLILGA